ncbi:MAG: hypothetical protein BAA04_06985 [Firmicutes bacterium ZCTH02-B6]|nr:MAG: hypothetical protein BAA04_06985 [Firmicutes bacterium ZCTH02-B6]
MNPIRQRREALKLSVEEACVRSGVSYSMWIKVERNERRPRFRTAQRMAQVLRWSVAELYDALDAAEAQADVVQTA